MTHRNTCHRILRSAYRLPLLAVLPTTVACGSTGEGPDDTESTETTDEFPAEMLPAALAPDLPLVAPTSELDIPVFSGIVEVEPGEDVTFCTVTDVILEEDRIFGPSVGAQSPQGHHAILQYTTTPQEPHTGSCGADMGQMLLGGTGGKEVADELYLPENFGVEVPEGAQLVLNHHWINTSTETIDGQAMMLARGLERGGDTVQAGQMIMLGFGWEIPPRAEYSYSTECTFGEDVPYVMALGHMHEWGSNVSVEVETPEGEVSTLFDDAWTEEMATGADGGHVYSLEDPVMIRKDETVRLTCDWHNETEEAIGFPREMCIFFGYTIGNSYFCANGAWFDSDAAAAQQGSQDVVNHL
jgi:hypothetical protein